MSAPETNEISRILNEWREGNNEAAERLFPLVYDHLRFYARRHLDRERNSHTLQPTALVHEAYLRMASQRILDIQSRIHFYAIASRVMRQVLVDYARQFNAAKRGAASRLSVTDIDLVSERSETDLLDLNDALERLAAADQRKAKVVDMRFFGGLAEQEIAEILGVSEKTVRRDWQFAKLWLLRELSSGESADA